MSSSWSIFFIFKSQSVSEYMRKSHEITLEVAPKNDLGSHRFCKGVLLLKFATKKFTEGYLKFIEASEKTAYL
jgi:hypothetical protein